MKHGLRQKRLEHIMDSSELCGPKHAFMPINVKVVSQDEFDNWLNFAKVEYASSKTNFNQIFQVAKN